MPRYRYIERYNMGVIQEYDTTGWIDRNINGIKMKWTDIGRSYNKKDMKELYDKSYKHLNKFFVGPEDIKFIS